MSAQTPGRPNGEHGPVTDLSCAQLLLLPCSAPPPRISKTKRLGGFLPSTALKSWAREGERVCLILAEEAYISGIIPPSLPRSTIRHFPDYKFSELLCRNINLPILVGGACLLSSPLLLLPLLLSSNFEATPTPLLLLWQCGIDSPPGTPAGKTGRGGTEWRDIGGRTTGRRK